MLLFEEVLNDNEITNKLIQIDDRIRLLDDNITLSHAFDHALRVSARTEYILKTLNFSFETINNGKLAGLLHDIGSYWGRKKHPIKSVDIVKDYFKNKDISKSEVDEILEAILNHSEPQKILSDIHCAIYLSNKLDFCQKRMLPENYENETLEDVQYITDIN